MKKLKVLLKGPVLVQAGYGCHAREIFDSLFADPAFDVFVENINWGHCSFLTEDSQQKRNIRACIEKRVIEKHQGNNKFDVFVHVTIPNEFERQGIFNVGVTAGIETDRVSHVWVQKCNEMDLIVVPSEHSKKTLLDTMVDWQNTGTGQSGTLKVLKPVIVCSEGADSNIFKKKDVSVEKFDFESDFNFLCVGQWGKGGFGEDRKNIALLVRYFIEEFKGRKDVGLVLKLSMARHSLVDYDVVLKRLQEIKANFKAEEVPPIYLLHGNLTDEEMSDLYNHPKIKAMISLTHGEGFGRPLLEASMCELPVLATNWSGHLDFLKKGKFLPIDYTLEPIPEVAVWGDILIKDSRWACVKEEDVKRRMRKFVSSPSVPGTWAKDLGAILRNELDVKKTNDAFNLALKSNMIQQAATAVIDPLEHLQSLVDTPDSFNVIYTMPRSTGDVYISTAVIDGLMKELPPDAKIYFATSPQYMDILKGNPNIHKVIEWNQNMLTLDLLEKVFDLALTPDVSTQYTFSNWVRRGQGRLLAEEFANHCQTQLGDYFIQKDDLVLNNPDNGLTYYTDNGVVDNFAAYMTFHPGSGKDQWAARRYDDWQEVLNNVKKLYPQLKVVQVGSADEPRYDLVDVDLRGKTTHQQLASIIQNSKLHLSIDTFTMHLAASLNVPLVALFGCSYATSTGPWVKNKETARFILLQSERLSGCRDKACYKSACAVNPDHPPINEIDPKQVVASCCAFLGRAYGNTFDTFESYPYDRLYKKLSGYTTTYNAMDYPFRECVKSMLGFCDEVVVVDGGSTDGTWEELEALSKQDSRVKIHQNQFDWEEPGMDGMQKAFARAMCEGDFVWQMDCDEVVHEDDYEKIKMFTKRFPVKHDIVHLPVIELWSSSNEVTGRRHSWKWRMSRHKPEINHGINNHARVVNEKTGRVYAKKGMSDGCEYVNVMTNEHLPHTGFYNDQIELARLHMPDKYAEGMNQIFEHIPSVYHYSWFDIPRKIRQLKKGGVWDKMWSLLYQEETQERFPGVETDEQIQQLADKLYAEGGEPDDKIKYKFKLERSQPAIMKEWIEKHKR